MDLELSVNGQIMVLKERFELDTSDELEAGRFYKFIKKGYHIFPLGKPLYMTNGIDNAPFASIEITALSHSLLGGFISTSGEYYIRNIVGKK